MHKIKLLQSLSVHVYVERKIKILNLLFQNTLCVSHQHRSIIGPVSSGLIFILFSSFNIHALSSVSFTVINTSPIFSFLFKNFNENNGEFYSFLFFNCFHVSPPNPLFFLALSIGPLRSGVESACRT